MSEKSAARVYIQANQPWFRIPLREIWEYKDLLWFMVHRDLVAQYRQTILGPLWIVIQPLATTIVFTVVFGNVAKIPTDGVPPFVFYLCGTMLWNYIKACLDGVSISLSANASMYGKVYFPRLIPSLVAIVQNLVKLGLNLLLFLAFWVYFLFFTEAQLEPNAYAAAFPLMIVYCAALGLGVGLWFTSLTAKYRDLKMAFPFLTQLWMFASPIVYPASLVPEKYHWLLAFNPIAGVTELNRYAFLGEGLLRSEILMGNLVVTAVILVSGLLYFNRVQRTFVDVI